MSKFLFGPPVGSTADNVFLLFQKSDFTFTSDFQQSADYNEMVYLNNCKNIAFWSCNFRGNKFAFSNGKAAIRGVNSSMFLSRHAGSLNAADRY